MMNNFNIGLIVMGIFSLIILLSMNAHTPENCSIYTDDIKGGE